MQTLISGDGKGGATGADQLIKDGDTKSFMTDVIDASYEQAIIVDFWAPWCGPCKTLGPMLEKLVREAKGAVRLVKIDVDRNQDLAMQLQVSSIPAVYAFKDGRPVDRFVGALPESQLKQWVRRLMGASGAAAAVAEAVAQARAALDQGDLGLAANIYGQVLKQEPTNPAAIGGMGRVLVARGQRDQAKQLLASVPDEQANHQEVTGLRALIELTEGETSGRSPTELAATLDANPKDHGARYELAMVKFAQGDREAAVDELLEIVRRDRAWNEEAARKLLLKLFDAFGSTDPLTQSARRRLSSILFS